MKCKELCRFLIACRVRCTGRSRTGDSFAYDLDPTKAADSRVKVLDMLSTDRTAIFGYHFPWPGIGHVAREQDGFRYFPKPTRWITQALASPGRSDEVQVVSGGRLSCRMHR